MRLRAHWPTDREPPLLGALLTVRRELEILAEARSADAVRMHFTGPLPVPEYARAAFQSAHAFELVDGPDASGYDWPPNDGADDAKGRYLSTIRLSRMNAAPALRWPSHLVAQARAIAAELKGESEAFACMHVRTNADADAMGASDTRAWWSFAETIAERGATVLLLGHDRYETVPPKGVRLARELGLSLETQLAVIAQADAFLGAASGIANAAMLSDTPYVIFKDPSHHRSAMEAELGRDDRFPFAGERQRLWRRKDTLEALAEAWNLLYSPSKAPTS